jgi:hypothetical protein
VSASRIDVYDAADGSVAESNITSPYSEAEAFELDYAQSGDVMVLTHEDHQPRQLVRAADGSFSLSTLTLTGIPQFDYSDADSPTPANEVQTIAFDSSTLNGDEYKLELGGLETDAIRFSGTDAENHDRIIKALLDLPNTGSDGIAVSGTGIGPYAITFSGASANAWDLLAARYIYTQSANTNGFTIARTSTGTARTEDVWSATRGWPRTVTFHENRLWFGGSKSRPDTLWGSRVNQFFDFDTFRARDDDAINATLATSQVNVIQGIASGRALQVFTSGGEFAVLQGRGQPITPETFAIRRQTNYGAARIKPVIIDGSTLFIERGKKALREFVFAEAEDAYTAPPINIRAPSLFSSPVDLAAAGSNATEAASYVYVVNDDGTMAVLNTLRSEGITAWTKWETDGVIESVAVVDDVAWFCTQRTIDGSTVRFLEEARPTHRMDASTLYTSVGSTTITGLSELAGATVYVRDGNIMLGNAVVSGDGEVTTDVEVSGPEVGFVPALTIQTMPLVQLFQTGSTAPRNKRLVRSNVDLQATLDFSICGQDVRFASFSDVLGASREAFTGRRETRHDGWVEDELVVTISQELPFPFQMKGLELEVMS